MTLPLSSRLRGPISTESGLLSPRWTGLVFLAGALIGAVAAGVTGLREPFGMPSLIVPLLAGGCVIGLAAGIILFHRVRVAARSARRAAALQIEAEQRLQDLARVAGGWFWETDAGHRVRQISAQVDTLSGLMPVARGAPAGAGGADLLATPRLLATLETHKAFTDLHCDTGSPPLRRQFCLSGTPLFTPAGIFDGYRGVTIDVTRQVAARDLADSAKAQLVEAIDGISEGFVLFDADDRLVLCNDKAHRIMLAGDLLQPGISFRELVEAAAKTGRVRVPNGDSAAWIEQRMAQHVSAVGVNEQQLADGRWISVSERRTRDGGIVILYADITASKAREAALTDSEARAARLQNQLVDAIESISEGFVLYDAANRLVMCNRHYREMYPGAADLMQPGTLRTDITNKMVASRDIEEVTERDRDLHHLMETPGSPRPTLERRLSNGRWIRVSESRTHDGGIVGVRTDITEAKRREAELAHQTGLLQTTFENMAHGISIIDKDLNLVGYNRLFLEMLDLPRELFARPGGVNMAEVVRYNAARGEYGPGDIEEQVRTRVARAATAEPHWFERTRPDGTVIEVRGNPLPGGGFVSIYTDITARRKAEAALRASEDRYRQLVEVSPDAILVHRDARISFANSTAVQLFGCSSLDDLVGRTVFDLVHADFHPLIAERIRKMQADGNPAPPIEIKIFRRDGTPIEAEVSAAVLLDLGGRAILTVVRDISARRRADVELRTAKEQAEMANRSKNEFLANMSHELRTPLNAVIGFSEIIASQLFGPLGSSRYVEYAEDIRGSGQHLLSLINDILDLSKAEAGKLELREAAVDVAAAVDASLRLVRERAEHAGVRLRSRIDSPAKLQCDERMLKQILLNLLSNAIKFTPKGGEVKLLAGIDQIGAFVLQITDTGIGMAKEDIPRALQAFTQIDSALNRKHDGTGLGLPLSKTMVELHGGRLNIESAIGQGTVVTVILPAERILH